ncbi:MAG: ATP-binding protein [Pseudomonadota bacterium]
MSGNLLARLRRQFSECMVEHQMLAEGDHVLIGLSGGKDSLALLALFADLRPRAPFRFTLSAVMIDGGLVGFDSRELEKSCAAFKVPFVVEKQPIFETVADKKDEGSTFCSMCAKLRRGALYSMADRLGATKIALGHHLDDAIETLLLNLFFGGRTAALPPVLLSDAGHVPILRPLLYCSEADLAEYVHLLGFPTVGCACPICPTHPEHEHSDLRRKEIKLLLTEFGRTNPQLREHARAAFRRVETSRFGDPRFSEKGTDYISKTKY